MKHKPAKTRLSAPAVLTAAREAYAQGRAEEAEAMCRRVLAVQPNNVGAMLLLAGFAVGTDRLELAQELLRSAVALDPNSVQALLRLARLLRLMNGHSEAVELCRRVITLEPKNVDAHFVLGLCLTHLMRLSEAVEAFEEAIALQPDFGLAHERLGYALQCQGRTKESIAAYRIAISLSEDVPDAYANLGKWLMGQGATAEAEAVFAEAFQTMSQSEPKLRALARAYRATGDAQREESALRKVLELWPDSYDAPLLLSHVLQESGRFQEAAEVLRGALAAHPERPGIYRELAYAGKVTQADASLVEGMTLLLMRPSLSLKDRCNLHHALGKAFDDLGDYGEAMTHFHEANRAQRRQPEEVARDRRAFIDQLEAQIQRFTPEFFEAHKGMGTDSEEPVFIVSTPRAGSTLIEQIISSHPDVGACGEVSYLSVVAPRLADPKAPPRPENIAELTDGYLRAIRSMTNGENRITDKMPINFMFAGLIHLAFPNARIIHCRRNPIDTCLSIYTTPFSMFSKDSLSEIAFAYHAYQRLMAHWRRVLTADRFFELDYEEVATDPEPVTRRVIEFLGLPWDDAVLKPEQNSRSIQTASRWQVRQPIHTASVERWRRYAPWIGELLKEFPEAASAAFPQTHGV